MPSSFLEPYHPIVRAGVHAETVAAYSWLLQQHPSAAKSHVDRLDMDTVHVALTAAADFAMLLGARAKELRALPKRAETVCQWCEDPNCSDRFDHSRLDAANETTWRRRARA